MNRIVIVGCGGSGKSHLARELGRALVIPVHHLDQIFWKPDWMESGREEFVAAQKQIFTTSRWIIDGNYGGTMDLRLAQADAIIFLDHSTLSCLWGVVIRYFRFRNAVRPDMTEGNKERLNFEFLKWIISYRRLRRPKILSKLRGMMERKEIVILTNRQAGRQFIDQAANKQMQSGATKTAPLM